MKFRLSEWILFILIILFFAIPICSLAVTEPVTSWPNCTTFLIYNLFLR